MSVLCGLHCPIKSRNPFKESPFWKTSCAFPSIIPQISSLSCLFCAAYVTAQKYGVDVSGFSFDKVCEMQAFGQKDPKDLRSFIQDVKSAAYSIGKQVDRNLGKSEQEFMPDEFAVPEEKTEKPAKNKKSPER